MIDLFTEDVRRDPYPFYKQLCSISPVFHETRSGIWMVLDYEGVRRVLSDVDAFSSNVAIETGGAPEWLVFFDPPRHTKLRALIARAFTPRSIAALESRIRQISRELLTDSLLSRGEMDLVSDYAVQLPLIVIAEMLGIPIADRERFKRWNDVMLSLIFKPADSDERVQLRDQYRRTVAEMKEYVDALLELRRATPADDLLTRLLQAEVDGEHLTNHEILCFFQILLVAGSETTTNLISNAILCLIDHPDQLALLRQRPDLLPSLIEEVLRYRSPGQAMFRVSRREVELHGNVIPKDKLFFAIIGSANRDPKQFADPDRFDITRDPNPHISFGHGSHFCLGAPLSRLESRIALTDLLQRMRSFELAGNKPWEPRRALHVHGPTHLSIRFERAEERVAISI